MSINKLIYTDMAEMVIMTTARFEDFEKKVLQKLENIEQGTQDKTEPRWLKSGDVKTMLGISHGKLQDLRDRGLIPFTKLGGVIFYDRKEIEKILLKGMQSK